MGDGARAERRAPSPGAAVRGRVRCAALAMLLALVATGARAGEVRINVGQGGSVFTPT